MSGVALLLPSIGTGEHASQLSAFASARVTAFGGMLMGSRPSDFLLTETFVPGARVAPDGVHYCVWAPDHQQLATTIVRADGAEEVLPMQRQADGYFTAHDPRGVAGDRYYYLLPHGDARPDPASRFQPDGVHGPSECIDPSAYVWKAANWKRPGWRGQAIYEIHLGTFTPEGTFRAAIDKLDHVVALGAEAIELMPIADFPGQRNWGYDGVALFAPARCYGRPDDFRALVDAAHQRGLIVILDVVYNHLGPDGNYLAQFSSGYFHPDRHTPWGQAFHLSGSGSRPARNFFLSNAAYWLDEFRVDGLRLDATHAIEDDSPRHLLAEIADLAHERGAFLIAEDERNSCDVLKRPDGSGAGIDAAWADDFHHQVRVALTGVQESYFGSYRGNAEEIVRTLGNGWFYVGQSYPFWKGRPKGESCRHLPTSAFVYCIENHDQVGNRALGERLEHLIDRDAFRAASALLCLIPYAPLLFMGQEWAASTAFLYFTDHAGELGQLVSKGRQKEFSAAGLNQHLAPENVPDPQRPETFECSKLNWAEVRQGHHGETLELYRTCLEQRKIWLKGEALRRENWQVAAVGDVVVIRYQVPGQPVRLIMSSLQGGVRVAIRDDSILRPPPGCHWKIEFETATTKVEALADVLDALHFPKPATIILIAKVAEAAPARRFAAAAQRIPVATYRLQLRKEFTLDDATALVPYARALGISDFYCSPVFLSTPGSSHGYDVNDYRRIDPELGGRTGLEHLHAALREKGMGLLLDFVPNHMGINGPGLFNRWWSDVLENGEHSPYARFFDIDWSGFGTAHARVLVPTLEDHYGRVLEAGKLTLVYENGGFSIAYYEMRFPVAPRTYRALLEAVRGTGSHVESIDRLMARLDALPRPDAREEVDLARKRKEQLGELKQEVAVLVDGHPVLRENLERYLKLLNGTAGDSGSFDQLSELIEQQHYRLAFWKAGVHETNYRRFFAIDTLIGLRMELPEVFHECHALLSRLIREQIVTGLRIDHIDGLRDPQQYLERLQGLGRGDGGEAAQPFYVVVEKILAENEPLPPEWLTHGATGYEFIGQLAGVLVDPRAERRFNETYAEFTGETASFEDVVFEKKRLVLEEMFANAVTRLATMLADLLQADLHWRDLTRHEITVAVRELMAAHGVYRTYRRGVEKMTERDRRVVEQAAAIAMARNRRLGAEPFELVRDVLIGIYPSRKASATVRDQLAAWVLEFQQYTGAVMAKSVEDTAFYTYSRFIALNEVGGHPGRFGGTVAGFHAANEERMRQTPLALLTTSTHDTKLGEDVRARLYALSEIPYEWRESVVEWRELNRRHKTSVDGRSAPDANEEFRLYQILIGAWPADDTDPDDHFRTRIKEHLRKAVNEARRNTSWIQPNEAWLEACDRFVDGILNADGAREFLTSFRPRAQRIAQLGMVNSLTQVVLKATSPGVPDFYQGCELWDLSLVDPDNRREVDFRRRHALLQEGEAALDWERLLCTWRTGEIKFQLTRVLLNHRAEHAALFQSGDYRPLEVRGRFAEHIVAFARTHGDDAIVVVVPRLVSRLGSLPLGLVWDDTAVSVPSRVAAWSDVATRRIVENTAALPISKLFAELPFAVLKAQP